MMENTTLATEPRAGIRPGFWLELGGTCFGPRYLELLSAVGSLGSLGAAAKACRIGYRTAWSWVEAMNKAAGLPLVQGSSGGRGGGHSELTSLARQLVDRHSRALEYFARLDSEPMRAEAS